jgi:hypothetical protein
MISCRSSRGARSFKWPKPYSRRAERIVPKAQRHRSTEAHSHRVHMFGESGLCVAVALHGPEWVAGQTMRCSRMWGVLRMYHYRHIMSDLLDASSYLVSIVSLSYQDSYACSDTQKGCGCGMRRKLTSRPRSDSISFNVIRDTWYINFSSIPQMLS